MTAIRRICGSAAFRRAWRWASDRDGNMAIEFAFVLPLLLVLVFGAIEFGRALWLRNTLQYVVEETGRYALTHTDATNTQLLDYAEERLQELTTRLVSFTASRETVSGTEYLELHAACDFAFVLPLPTMGFELTGRVRVPLIDS